MILHYIEPYLFFHRSLGIMSWANHKVQALMVYENESFAGNFATDDETISFTELLPVKLCFKII